MALTLDITAVFTDELDSTTKGCMTTRWAVNIGVRLQPPVNVPLEILLRGTAVCVVCYGTFCAVPCARVLAILAGVVVYATALLGRREPLEVGV